MDFIKYENGKYIRFYDRVAKKMISLGLRKETKEEDYKVYSDFSKKHYSDKPKHLPKRIFYNKKNELFYVQFCFKGKKIGLGSYHTLEEAEKELLDFKIFLIT